MSVVSLARMAGVTWLVVEQPLLEREHRVGAAAHEHDVDQPLPHVLADQFAVFVQRAEAALLGMMLRAAAGRGDAIGHVGVFGVGQDKIVARRIGSGSATTSRQATFAAW